MTRGKVEHDQRVEHESWWNRKRARDVQIVVEGLQLTKGVRDELDGAPTERVHPDETGAVEEGGDDQVPLHDI